jgi:hypothetical protein
MHKWASQPFRESLEALAQLALQETGALGFAYFAQDTSSSHPTRLAGGGSADFDFNAIVQYSLGQHGDREESVAFAFPSADSAAAARIRLDRIADAIRLLWSAGPVDAYRNLFQRLAGIEMQLIDSKIADRARGLLSANANDDPSDAIARHVEGVLRPSQARITLEHALAELEEEMEERKLMTEAKRILQMRRGLSEEQAHAELRLVSRKSRKRLKEVALQVIGRQQLSA